MQFRLGSYNIQSYFMTIRGKSVNHKMRQTRGFGNTDISTVINNHVSFMYGPLSTDGNKLNTEF